MKKFVSLLLTLVMLVAITPVSALAAEETVSTEMAVSSVTLRTLEGKEGIFYGASFKLSADTVALMEADSDACYGLALSTANLETQQAWTDGLNGVSGAATVLRSIYDFNDAPLTANKSTKVNSTSLVNIININNDTLTNLRNAATVVYVRPYYCINGQFTYGAVQSCSMQDVAEMVDDYYNYVYPTNGKPFMNDTQKKGLLGMYERFSITMSNWDMPDLIADYEAGNPLILQYRREKVVAGMQAQADVLWTFEGSEPVTYGRVVPSDGDKDDILNQMQYAGTFYTFYPGRIYKGLPYTHAAGSLNTLYTMSGGKPNAEGVYVLQGLNRSFLNSEPSDGSEGRLNSEGQAVGQFNVARLGTDCWDAISWAYESVGADVDADQTDHVTPDYDMYPVGNYNFDVFMDTDGTHYDTAIFKTVIDEYFSSGNTEEIDRIYDAYAQMQPGDAMVGDSFSILCTGVEVVYKSSENGAYIKDADGNYIYEGRQTGENRYDIDAENSLIHFLELNSSEDLAQSHPDEFFIYDLSAHEAGTCVAKQCKYCAGYDEETGVWNLAIQKTAFTFQAILQTKYFVPLRPALLNDANLKPAQIHLKDSEPQADVTKIFDGTLQSNNRICEIRLDIYQNDSLVNSTSAFSIDLDLTDPYALSRLATDYHAGAFGSVLHGTPGLLRQSYDAQYAQKLDANKSPVTETVAAGDFLYQYTELKDADGNTVYREGVTDADGNPVPVMVRVKSKCGSDVYTIATEDVEVPAYDTLVDNTYVVEADPHVLGAGEYYYEMTCYLGSGHIYTFRSGFFTVTDTMTEAGNYTVVAD